MGLREVLADLSVKVTGTEKLKAADSGVSALTGNLKTLAGIMSGGAFINGAKSFVQSLVDQGSALNDTSQQLGINVGTLEAWQFAAKLNGVEAGELSASLGKLQKNMVDSAKGGAETGGEFQKLGVSLRDAKGNVRETTDVLYDTGLAISRLPKGAEQSAAAMEIFGRAGRKLLPMFSEGEEGLKKYLNEVKNLGGGIGGDAVGMLDDLGDNMDRFEMATTSAKTRFLVAFLPALTQGVQWLTKLAVNLSTNKQALGAIAVVAGTVGAAFAVAGAEALLPWVPMLLLFSALLLVAQDFYVGLNGGQSAIGDLIKSLFGEKAAASFFVEVKKDAAELLGFLRDVLDALKEIKNITSGKTFGEIGDIQDAGAAKFDQGVEVGQQGGYLGQGERAQLSGTSDSRLQDIGVAKEILAAPNINFTSLPGEVDLARAGVNTEQAQQLVDQLHSMNLDATSSFADLQAAIEASTKDNAAAVFAEQRAAGVSPAGVAKTQNVALNANTNINVTVKSSEKDDVTDGLVQGVQQSNEASAANLAQYTK